mmetsp:Transcript_23018/g.22177  ORF Transcript_23018/g.22177 Transcript_23018/m.22177 type:complete len:332 (+) Transcript_23018:88-1083(+)
MSSILGFETQFYDPVSGIAKKLYLKFYLDDNTIEILDEKAAFLKRIYYPDVKLTDLYVGSSITVFNRLIQLKKCANSFTENYMNSREVHLITVFSLKESHEIGQFLRLFDKYDLNIGKIRTTKTGFSGYGIDIDEDSIIIEAIVLKSIDIQSFINDSNNIFPNSVTMVLGADKISELMAECSSVPVPDYCTLCIIKPHVLKANKSGDVLSAITEKGFCISGLHVVHFTPEMAQELMDVYTKVYPSYSLMLEQLCAGPLLAVMVTGSEDIVSEFRAFSGPLSPELARTLRPDSLRALFGSDTSLNAVHCTDLSEDGDMECRYIFETLFNIKV